MKKKELALTTLPEVSYMPDSPYNINDVGKLAPQEGKIYLLDANVWLFVIRPPSDLKPYEKAYVDFFEAVLTLASNEKCKARPLIFLNGLIISEVYNAFMKNSCKAYNDSSGTDLKPKEYRKTDDFKKILKSIQSDFAAYNSVISGDFNSELNPQQILYTLPIHSDYNDHYYYHLAMEKDMIVVTNDGDFDYPGVEIITNNFRLLKLK